jgi:cysteine sulfinate desulfinase/cysteine desulfurase-like protein
LLAIGVPPEMARSAIRFSLGKQTTADEIEQAGAIIARTMERLERTRRARAEAYAVV